MAEKDQIRWLADHSAPVGGGAVVLGLALIIGIDAYTSFSPFSFRNYQTLLTGLAAVCAALIAYAAATREQREARKAAEEARIARKLKTILQLVAALEHFRNTTAMASESLWRSMDFQAREVLSAIFSVPPGLANAVENLDVHPPRVAVPVSRLFAFMAHTSAALAEGPSGVVNYDTQNMWRANVEKADKGAKWILKELQP